MRKDTYRGYTVGKKYKLTVEVVDENNTIIPAGTIIRLVAIAPKVRMVTGKNKDTWMYFYNAVISTQENDYSNRIRQDFCTIRRCKHERKRF